MTPLPPPYYPGIAYTQDINLNVQAMHNIQANALGSLCAQLQNPNNTYIDCIHQEDRNAFIKNLTALQKQSTPLEYRFQNKETHEVVYIIDYRQPITNKQKKLTGYQGFLFDNTRCRIAEKRLEQACWKESLSIITSGLVHDFSNVMAGIFSLSELYYANMDESNPMHEGLGQIKKSAQEARQLVRRIIDLNREESGSKAYHNLEQLIKDQIEIIRVIMPKSTQIHIDLTQEEIPVYLDSALFRQTLLNLAINARDALEEQGNISISTARIQAGDQPFQTVNNTPFLAPEDGVLITFKDNGIGISSENIKKIFSPFFSTKEASKGSGLGLYNAKHFFDENQGHLSVSSKLNQGTTFFMYLPLASWDNDFNNQEQEIKTSKPNIIIYSSKELDAFDITSLLRKKDWGLLEFKSLQTLKEYLKETRYTPQAFHTIDVGQDPDIEQVIKYLKKEYPHIKRTLHVIGKNPDEIPTQLRNSVDHVFDTHAITMDIADSIDKLIH